MSEDTIRKNKLIIRVKNHRGEWFTADSISKPHIEGLNIGTINNILDDMVFYGSVVMKADEDDRKFKYIGTELGHEREY